MSLNKMRKKEVLLKKNTQHIFLSLINVSPKFFVASNLSYIDHNIDIFFRQNYQSVTKYQFQ